MQPRSFKQSILSLPNCSKSTSCAPNCIIILKSHLPNQQENPCTPTPINPSLNLYPFCSSTTNLYGLDIHISTLMCKCRKKDRSCDNLENKRMIRVTELAQKIIERVQMQGKEPTDWKKHSGNKEGMIDAASQGVSTGGVGSSRREKLK